MLRNQKQSGSTLSIISADEKFVETTSQRNILDKVPGWGSVFLFLTQQLSFSALLHTMTACL